MAQSPWRPRRWWWWAGLGGLAAGLGVGHVADVAALRGRLDAGEPAPERVIIDETGWREPSPGRSRRWRCRLVVQAETTRVLGEVQALLAEPRLAPAALVWVTSSAISTGADDGVGDLVHAPLWGLLRSTRTEHADRGVRLVDVDEPGGEALWPLLAADGSRSWRGAIDGHWRRGCYPLS